MKQWEVATGESTVIIPKLRIAETHWEKFRGLMMNDSMKPTEALLIRKCNSIHCCFMKIPIDVLFLNRDGRVIHIIPRMKPWRFSPIVRKAVDVLECFPGTVEKYGLSVGLTLSVREVGVEEAQIVD